MEDDCELRKLPDGGVGSHVDGEGQPPEVHASTTAGDSSPSLHGVEQDRTPSLQGEEGDIPLALVLPPVPGKVPDRAARGGIRLREKVILLFSFLAGVVLACFLARREMRYQTIDSTFKENDKVQVSNFR